MKALLIDVGSTFIKYSIYDREQGIIFFNKTPFPEPMINDGVRFIVSRENLCNIIFSIFEKTKSYDYNIALFSVQMHGYVARLKDGSFSEYVSWRDMSGNACDEKFKNVNFNEFGLSLSKNLPVTKINNQTVSEFFTLGSYLSYALTGNNLTHITDAFASGFYYSPQGVPNQFASGMVMPSVVSEVEEVGEYNGVKIICPFGDHQVSVIGSGVQDFAYLINVGTGAQVCCVSSYGEPDGLYQKRPYFDKNSCLYSFCGLHGVNGGSRDKSQLVERILSSIVLLPKKDKVIIGGGGASEILADVQKNLAKLNVSVTEADFNIGTQGLINLLERYISK